MPSPSTLSAPALPAPLGPYPSLPTHLLPLREWRILILVTSVNSFVQKVVTYFDHLGISEYAVQIAGSAESMVQAAERFEPDVVLCPFLTARIPESVFTKWMTLVIHPGPPGDAGPSSLDWVLMGDTGLDPSSTSTLSHLLSPEYSLNPTQRSHWGTICFQANEELDGGAVWAWEQYPLPAIGEITKAQLYQGLHSQEAMLALITALFRVYEKVQAGVEGVKRGERGTYVHAKPEKAWGEKSITDQKPFLGGPVYDRHLLQSKSRRPDWSHHTAQDVLRIISAGDSQPGGQLPALSSNSKTSLFAYGACIHSDPSTVPSHLYSDKWATLDDVPDGTVLAVRDGAVFIKTQQRFGAGAGIWITHGRLPKKSLKDPLDPKVPMVDAILKSGHGVVLEGVKEWPQDGFDYKKGEWQAVYVKQVQVDGGLGQMVYWNFYNGAFTTANCQLLLRALQWAVHPSRGNTKILALMGGSYFSNGIALNTIEASPNPGKETWANINAIDDLVEFLLGDPAPERSEFMQGQKTLVERGIVTMACLRGNAAAGGVALAAACDVVVGARGVVLNPAYRAMGLHGSEFHSYSYATRCGPIVAAHLLRDMTPISTTFAREKGLIDVEVGSFDSSPQAVDQAMTEQVRYLLGDSDAITPGSQSTSLRCAPWATASPLASPTIESISYAKLSTYNSPNRSFPPLVQYRTEELSQMLLDSFHPNRSKRYHTRREAFIRKYKSTATPARYARALATGMDEEDLPSFDDAEGWTRGEEWAWVGLPTPTSMATSEYTRIDLYPVDMPQERKGSVDSNSSGLTSASSDNNEMILPTTPKKAVRMGMQGFKGLDLGDDVAGTKGDVQFQCLYQAEA